MNKLRKMISIVVSVYNEEDSLQKFYNTSSSILEECEWDYEIIFVNDGSQDSSLKLLETFAIENKKVKVINFTRNFGHEAAMIAGIDYAKGDGIICMDADLQHPPEQIPQIIEKMEQGNNVISMIRTKNKDAGWIKRITSGCFYKVLNILSPVKFESNASDFFAITKDVAEVLRKEYREKVRYLRGYVQSVGFSKTTLEFEAKKREAGKSKYNIHKLLKFSINVLCSFSDLPLKLGIYFGFSVGFLGIILLVYTLIMKFFYSVPSGYTTIIIVLCFMFAVLFIVIGLIGEYIAVLFAEIKNRPIYIVYDTKNLDETNNKDI